MNQENLRKFRRYDNRKIYDVDNSTYATLEQIVSLVREGYDVNVVRHGTNEDITQRTLVEAINRVATKTGSMHSYSTLTSLIKTLDLTSSQGQTQTTTQE